jgi:hypothetical protein
MAGMEGDGMRNHGYGKASATHKVKTAYGTYRLCAACVLAGHLGTKRARSANPLERLPVSPAGACEPSCECEHVDHFHESRSASAAPVPVQPGGTTPSYSRWQPGSWTGD